MLYFFQERSKLNQVEDCTLNAKSFKEKGENAKSFIAKG